MWAAWAAYLSILLGALLLGLDGIDRSLWLDEAWVANSVHEPTLGGMFYYPEWLQTSPPLFLLIARLLTHLIGFNTTSLRLISLIFAIIAAAGFLAVLRRVVTAPVALLAAVLLVFHPLPVEYFRSFKQYGAEMAATAMFLLASVVNLQFPGRREFLWLLLTTLLVPLSYPLVFLLPGMILAVWFSDRVRAAVLAGAGAVVMGILYVLFIRPNVAPALWTYWRDNAQPDNSLIAIVAAAAVYAIWRRREWIMLICLLPCALLVLAEVSGWYPASPRARLFVRPCLLLALAIPVNDLVVRMTGRWKRAHVAVTLAAVAVMGWGLSKQFTERRGEPQEDYSMAIRLLRARLMPGDLVLVHPSAREGFRLYTEIENWHPAVIYGDTGWPCCPRSHSAGPRSSTEVAVRQDLNAKIPPAADHFWLLLNNRPSHWRYASVDETVLWPRLLAERGCVVAERAYPANLVTIKMVCSSNSP